MALEGGKVKALLPRDKWKFSLKSDSSLGSELSPRWDVPSGATEDAPAVGVLEGVTSLHSWLTKQTMIFPTKKMSRYRSLYDNVRLYLRLKLTVKFNVIKQRYSRVCVDYHFIFVITGSRCFDTTRYKEPTSSKE